MPIDQACLRRIGDVGGETSVWMRFSITALERVLKTRKNSKAGMAAKIKASQP